MMEVWNEESFGKPGAMKVNRRHRDKAIAYIRQRRFQADIDKLLQECERLREKLVKNGQQEIIGI